MRLLWTIGGFIVGVFVTALGVGIWHHLVQPAWLSSGNIDAPAILHDVQGLTQLTSVKYTIQKAVGLEDKKYPFGSEKILLFVQADVLAGTDLSRLVPGDVQKRLGGKINIVLPQATIQDVIIDDKVTKVWDRSITWWTPWVPYNQDLERQARITARQEIEKAALEGGILDQARQNAETAIRRFLEMMGMRQVVFEPSLRTGV